MTLARTLMASAASIGLAAGLLASAPAAAEKWDMPLAYAASNYHSENAADFAKCVTDGTGGKLEVITHPSGSLFKGNEIKRAVQTGQAPIGERLLSAHANENAIYGIDSIPFLATSFEAAEKLSQAATPTMEKILESQNLVLLYSVAWPPQGLYFKKDVNSVADMKGIKFRSYNTATARMAELAGMLPVQVEAAELSQALATGVAEAFISSGATGYDRKVWEQLTHFYEVDAWLPRNTVFANKDAWNGLDDAKRTTIKSCATTAAAAGLKRAIAYTDFTLNGLREGGMKVQKAGDQLRADLNKIGETMSAEWLKEAGAEGKAIVDKFKGM